MGVRDGEVRGRGREVDLGSGICGSRRGDHHITSHHITSHHITSHHITSYLVEKSMSPNGESWRRTKAGRCSIYPLGVAIRITMGEEGSDGGVEGGGGGGGGGGGREGGRRSPGHLHICVCHPRKGGKEGGKGGGR